MTEKQKRFLNELTALLNKYNVEMVKPEYREGTTTIRFLSNYIDLAFQQYYDGQFSGCFTFTPTEVSPYFPEPVTTP